MTFGVDTAELSSQVLIRCKLRGAQEVGQGRRGRGGRPTSRCPLPWQATGAGRPWSAGRCGFAVPGSVGRQRAGPSAVHAHRGAAGGRVAGEGMPHGLVTFAWRPTTRQPRQTVSHRPVLMGGQAAPLRGDPP
eukprot:CAMPEP_0174350810 /NCGR_PEP_ID=MMETSP0811_2-20130205/7984_1 /TAXON_ID=73025 ORGANISM="Eutreptiella gymnastica-like, Strain CCMP1594" /NCGR_SAMPLE_ID=MMETSP0811_2 /ASSEMBLY_ACC=CAM_ASM_000667 /LENGTH=132 /DNA_ID=CAMNT_0015479467 /DNA_START=628 /DNA_END=1021 /DNA_ORIENTATION=+